MTTTKRVGIWMDHASANMMEFNSDAIETTTIVSDFTHSEMEETLGKGEHVMHNKEQHQQADYYKKLGEVIKGYDAVLLFGPTNAKAELLNMLRADRHFEKIHIDVMPADKMTDHQQHAFVKEHFSKH